MNFRKEPTPDPSQEGNCPSARADLLPSSEGLGVGLPDKDLSGNFILANSLTPDWQLERSWELMQRAS